MYWTHSFLEQVNLIWVSWGEAGKNVRSSERKSGQPRADVSRNRKSLLDSSVTPCLPLSLGPCVPSL